jgi:replicative DNA helicase
MNAPARIPYTLPLPESIDLEQAVLGSCIANNGAIDDIFGICSPLDFYHAPHREIAEAIVSLSAANLMVSPLSLVSRLGADMRVCDLGGHEYLAGMALAAPSGGFKAIARNLSDLSQRREAMIACMNAQEALATRAIPLLQALAPALEAADRAASAQAKTSAGNTNDAIEAALKKAEDMANGKREAFIPSGLKSLDDVTGGLQAGDLCIYAGRPGMGKSSLLLTTAIAAAFAGRPVIVFSLEMTREQMLHRIGTDLDYRFNPTSPLSYSWFRSGSVRIEQVGRLAEALRQVPDNLEIRDSGDTTIHEMAAHAKAFAGRHGKMGIVVIDYLQKIPAGDRYRGNKVQEITEISGQAKALAKRIGWPVLAGAQLSRAVESRGEPRPTLSDLRESGAIEQDADQVIGLYRPGYYTDKRKPGSVHDPKYPEWEAEHLQNKNRLDLIVLKNRHGAEDVLSVFCEMRASAIRDEKPQFQQSIRPAHEA